MAKKLKKLDKKAKTPTKSPAKAAKAVKKTGGSAKKAAAPASKKKKVAVKAAPAKGASVKTAVKAGLKAVLKAVSKKEDKKAEKVSVKKEPKAKLQSKSAGKKVEGKVDLKVKKNKPGAVEEAEKAIEVKGKKAKKELVIEEEIIIDVPAPIKDVVLTDAEGRELCRVKDCDQPWGVEGYCRYHYLLFWKKIQNRKKILSEGKLEQYIEELTSRYPLKFLELIRKDLSSEPDFFSAIQELDIDESNNIDDFEDENFMEEVRGIGSTETERVDDEY
jgi:hypothetical protein